jgi:hypothetical protein
MLESVHRWLVDHPIWQSFIVNGIVGLALLVLAAYWKFIAAFSRVPPQRLGTWLRKARLNANVTKLVALRRANEKPRTAVVMFLDKGLPIFVYLGFEILGFALVVLQFFIPQPHRGGVHLAGLAYFMFHTRAGAMLWFFVPMLMLVIASFRLLWFASEYANFETAELKLLCKVNALRAKLALPLERIPIKDVEEVETDSESRTYPQGSRVKHPKYGEGIVFRTEGSGVGEKVTVQFARHGIKKLVAKFAQLERL